MGPVRRLNAAPTDGPVRFSRGRVRPRAIAWFGFSAFWGHLRHLLASAIATDNVDSRKWMTPESPREMLSRAVGLLGPRGAAADATSLARAFGGEVWVDFVADTGDDVTVSEAVARLVFDTYEVDDGGAVIELPRGQVLVLGGDLAYPVATVREVTRRLVVPWNRVLEQSGEPEDETPRLLLGVPGNHDWYDGLDGFARLCQAPCDFETPAPRSQTLYPEPHEFPVLAWAEAFSRGVAVRKPDALSLFGYYPIQRTSYFRLPLTRHVELWGVDRQLREVDARQRQFFGGSDADTPLVVLPDPARAWGETRPTGAKALADLGLDPAARRTYVLAGDVHHYERSRQGESVHVVAGGGGAFLHGARMAPHAAYRVDAEFPGPRASWRLLRRAPLYVAAGGAGWLVTCGFALLQALGLLAYLRHGFAGATSVALVESVLVGASAALLVGWRRHRLLRVVPFAAGLGVFIGALPLGVGLALDRFGTAALGGGPWAHALAVGIAWLVATLLTGAGFGAMLVIIARLGLNHAQPFAALGLPTHRHFVRLRVREHDDETLVDTFVIGQTDPVGGSPPVLVDRFRWSSRRGLA